MLAVVGASLSLLLAAVLVTSAVAQPNPFLGRWYSTDAYDLSSQTMNIGGADGHFRVTLYDDGASACNEDLSVAGVATGMFSQDGNTLSGSLSLRCLGASSSSGSPVNVDFTYDPGTNTLTDSFVPPTTWYRGP